MSIASQLTALQTDITNARTQITTMGGTVTSGGGSSQLATDISTIPTGGSGDLPIGSTITVTSDEGVTIEIERGTESQTLVVPSSGSVSFTVHQSGIWNLTANKTGETELTDTVVVSADDTDYPVSMFWRLYLYKDGEEYTSITGGWVGKSYESRGTTSKTSTTLVTTAYSQTMSYANAGFETTNLIDVTRYTKLKISYTLSGTEPSRIITATAQVTDNGQWYTGMVSSLYLTEGTHVDELSIESNPNVYIRFFSRDAASYPSNTIITCDSIWLE